jgi:hypothetical protein
MATSALSGFSVLFLLFSASQMLLFTEATRNLHENKATGNFSLFLKSIPAFICLNGSNSREMFLAFLPAQINN